MKATIHQKYLNQSVSYYQYKQLIDSLLIEGKTTGTTQSLELYDYARLNFVRMNRIEKTVEILPATQSLINQVDTTQHWFVLTEGWCGDAAQIVPVIASMVDQNQNIQLHILLRDENLDLMDKYLQRGTSRSIPKLIVTDEQFTELFNWGPRPKALQKIYDSLKASDTSFEELSLALHTWYNNDKTYSTQNEITELLQQAIGFINSNCKHQAMAS